MSDTVHVVSHPVVQHKLALARDSTTDPPKFRALLAEITELLAYEASSDVKTEALDVSTPVDWAEGQMLAEDITIVPILRAGLGMLEGATRLLPWARVGHLGVYRDQETFEPVIYYNRLPPDVKASLVFMLDAMLATGGSCSAAVDVLKRSGVTRLRVICLIATPTAIDRMAEDHADVGIYTASVDPIVGADGRISPGLGDVGARLFGTA
ncbi:MAG: uracil phosphoribosyltransferase [Phycisphaerae bacterium]|nr:uracil phosphoribosyltransferase [Phycisphaerae bacterium]